ncbi:FMN-binding protein [Catenuloplanes sp. NPDC051500]|uniref:FMN-binding protein n=1 Tax=Catenuloplanes sp. NPDC051500 TaxID=3363959 RepID=UPI00379DACFC
MRRSTAAVLGTLTGVAMIAGVRMTVPTQIVPVAETPAEDAAADAPEDDAPANDAPAAGKNDDKNGAAPAGDEDEDGGDGGGAAAGGLTDGTFKGAGAKNAYGTIQVTITVKNGKISAADATYPTAGNSATINPAAVKKLNASALKAETGDDVDAVSGATFTTGSYRESLQSALDKAKV